MREERVVLEHHADAALVRRRVVDRLALQVDFAMGGGLEARQHHQRRRLAGARGPEHGQELALGDVEIEIFDDERFAVIAFLHVDETHHGFAVGISLAIPQSPHR